MVVRKPIVKTSGFVTEKVEHNRQSIHAPGTFVLEWYENGKRQRKPLSESTLEAQDALRKKTDTLEARSNGLTVVEDHGSKRKTSLEAAVREYLEEVKLNRAHKTHLAYKRALDMLVAANPGCDFVQDLERIVCDSRVVVDASCDDHDAQSANGSEGLSPELLRKNALIRESARARSAHHGNEPASARGCL
jgi:hypothetical protein